MNLLDSNVRASELSLGELLDLSRKRSERAFRDYSRYQKAGDLVAARESWREYAEADDLHAMIDRLCTQVSGI